MYPLLERKKGQAALFVSPLERENIRSYCVPWPPESEELSEVPGKTRVRTEAAQADREPAEWIVHTRRPKAVGTPWR